MQIILSILSSWKTISNILGIAVTGMLLQLKNMPEDSYIIAYILAGITVTSGILNIFLTIGKIIKLRIDIVIADKQKDNIEKK